MATLVSPYSPFMLQQQSFYYPMLQSFYPSIPAGNYQIPLQTQVPQIQQQSWQKPTVEYVDAGVSTLRPRRQPRVFREVIVLPTPEPTYRQVRHRMPTPERKVFHRTIIQKSNGNVIVQEQQPTRKSKSRVEYHTQARPTRSRQIYTD